MKLKTSWTCPDCGEQVPVHLDALAGTENGSRLKVRIRMPDAALADVFKHAWTHPGGSPAINEGI